MIGIYFSSISFGNEIEQQKFLEDTHTYFYNFRKKQARFSFLTGTVAMGAASLVSDDRAKSDFFIIGFTEIIVGLIHTSFKTDPERIVERANKNEIRPIQAIKELNYSLKKLNDRLKFTRWVSSGFLIVNLGLMAKQNSGFSGVYLMGVTTFRQLELKKRVEKTLALHQQKTVQLQFEPTLTETRLALRMNF